MENNCLFHSGPATSLQGPVQSENVGLKICSKIKIPRWQQRALNQVWGPSKHRALCDCTSHIPMKPALVPFLAKPSYFTLLFRNKSSLEWLGNMSSALGVVFIMSLRFHKELISEQYYCLFKNLMCLESSLTLSRLVKSWAAEVMCRHLGFASHIPIHNRKTTYLWNINSE